MRLLRAGDVHGAVKQFDRWNRADGKVLPGLAVRARAAERDLFCVNKIERISDEFPATPWRLPGCAARHA